jgi:hypothetical protein
MSTRSGTVSGTRTNRTGSRKRLYDPRVPHPLDFVGTFVDLVSFSPLVVRCGLCHVEWRPVVDRDGKVQVGYSVCPKGCDKQQ